MLELLTDPQVWMSLLTLTALEIVLGIDNLIFLSIVSGRLPRHQQATARRIGSDNVFIRQFGGGVAVHAGDGAPFNKVAGLGFLGVPEEKYFEEIEQEMAARNAPVQVEVSTLAYPAEARMLTERRYARPTVSRTCASSPTSAST